MLVGDNDEMPTTAGNPFQVAALAYYRAVEATLLTHLRGRRVQGFGHASGQAAQEDAHAVDLHIADLADLDEAIRSGIAFFRLPGLTGPGLVSLRIRPGDGSGIDTVATATLALAQAMSQDGIAAAVMTDGLDGLYLIGFAVGPVAPSAVAVRYAAELTLRAPEIATTDPADFDGRTLICPLPVPGGRAVPAPYSLVSRAGGPGVAAPLTMDEVAATSAGMPLEIEPDDVVDRLGSYGDLAAGLGEATALPA